MYFREFGIPARIARCYNVEQLEEKIAEFNGKKNCYTSVYVFDDTVDRSEGKTNYDSAVLNTLWFDFDDNKNVSKCLKDVSSHVDLSEDLKRDMLRNYLTHLKSKYRLSTLDQACINNSVACLRRIPNTAYISKIEAKPTGVFCTQFTVAMIMDCDIAALYAMAMEDTGAKYPPIKSKKAQRRFIEFMCDELKIKHNVSLSVAYLLDKINGVESPIKHATHSNDYIMPLRECVIELIERNIERGNSGHEDNKIIGMEMINAGSSNRDIHFVFESIYDEAGADWGWYTDNPDKAGHIIQNMREKALNRYSKDKLIQMKVCTAKCSCV